MRHQALRLALKSGGHGNDRQLLLLAFEHLQVVIEDDVGLFAEQQLHAVDLWAAHADGHIQALFCVQAFSHSLIKTAVFGLCIPGGEQHDGVIGVGHWGEQQRQRPKRCSSESHGYCSCKSTTRIRPGSRRLEGWCGER